MQIFGSLILTIGMEPKQVEKVFTANPPDPIEMEKAKKMLKVSINHFLSSSFIFYLSLISTMIIALLLKCRNMNRLLLMQLPGSEMCLREKVVITK